MLANPSLSDFDAAFPGPAAGGPILALTSGRAYFRLPDDTIRYLSLNAPAAPANVTAPAITGTLTTGSTVTCSTGAWQGYPTSYAYQWTRDGSDISGETANTYELDAADEGTDLVCEVTATNVTGSTMEESNTVNPSAPGGYEGAVMADSPISWWRLEETTPGTGTAADEQGVNDGTYVGSPTGNQAGALSDSTKAVDFNGSSQYINVADDATLRVGDVFSIEMWVKPASGSAGGFMWFVSSTPDEGFNFYHAGGFAWRLGTYGGDMVASSTPLTVSVWNHIVATKNGATVKLYLNGVDVTGSVTNHTIASGTQGMQLGRSEHNLFDGVIDEIAIYDHALSGARIAAHYAAR
jgi:hypothetical protein